MTSPASDRGAVELSVVATARNDDHGGSLVPRMQAFVSCLAAQCERHALAAELVLVEWNPPGNRPRLAEVIDWPSTPWCTIRILEVSALLHEKLELADRLSLFQMIAKNVGIRRACGPYVLATNVDVLFPDELFAAIRPASLQPDAFYRADRYDVSAVPDLDEGVDAVFARCREQTIRICQQQGTRNLRTGDFYRIYENPRLPLTIRRPLRLLHAASARARSFGKPRPHLLPNTRRKRADLVLDTARRVRANWSAETVALHTNASGDFTLMSREMWAALRGYPELQLFSMHLDSLLLYQAHYAGYRQVILDAPIYHMDHTHGLNPDPREAAKLDARLARSEIPQLSHVDVQNLVRRMRRAGGAYHFNPPTWGMVDEEIPDLVMPHRVIG